MVQMFVNAVRNHLAQESTKTSTDCSETLLLCVTKSTHSCNKCCIEQCTVDNGIDIFLWNESTIGGKLLIDS